MIYDDVCVYIIHVVSWCLQLPCHGVEGKERRQPILSLGSVKSDMRKTRGEEEGSCHMHFLSIREELNNAFRSPRTVLYIENAFHEQSWRIPHPDC